MGLFLLILVPITVIIIAFMTAIRAVIILIHHYFLYIKITFLQCVTSATSAPYGKDPFGIIPQVALRSASLEGLIGCRPWHTHGAGRGMVQPLIPLVAP